MTKNPSEPAELLAATVREYADQQDRDLYLYSGWIGDDQVERFVSTVEARSKKRSNVSLFLTTYGGDAHAGYRLARYLQREYKDVRLLVAGPCKSAGTLIAIGAHSIAFGPRGELGPLDVQVRKQDEVYVSASGLDTFQAVGVMTGHAFQSFETYMLEIVERSAGAISTKTACEVATGLVVGLFAPMAGQIDPQRLGEVQRAMAIAHAYGERLDQAARNLHEKALDKLVSWYPSHGFNIDLEEASLLFRNAGVMGEQELALANFLKEGVLNPKSPSDTLIVDVCVAFRSAAETKGDDDETARGGSKDAGEDESREHANAPDGESAGGGPRLVENSDSTSVASEPRRKK